MKPEDLFGKEYREFDAEDPFNGNQVQGFICRCNSDLYGSLLVETVNGEKCSQLIRCTPKIKYPFDKDGKYNFPKAVRIERYEKLDGTNIFAYRYSDSGGRVFVTYKTRLMPFVGNSKFGPFREMLHDVLANKPATAQLPLDLGLDISFELWGARNPHLIKYAEQLELSVLFARDHEKILPPSGFETGGLRTATPQGIVDGALVGAYKDAQQDMESGLSETGDGYYGGVEGEVWYLLTDDGCWHQFKCKPETIEQIHWSAGGIGKNQIIATCENAFENWDNPSVDNIAGLLLEEFSQEQVDKAHYRIGKCLDTVIAKHVFMERILKDYRELGINILDDKVTVMRAMSGKYSRHEMQSVFSIIMAHT